MLSLNFEWPRSGLVGPANREIDSIDVSYDGDPPTVGLAARQPVFRNHMRADLQRVPGVRRGGGRVRGSYRLLEVEVGSACLGAGAGVSAPGEVGFMVCSNADFASAAWVVEALGAVTPLDALRA